MCDRYVCAYMYMYMCVCRCTRVLEDRGQQQVSPPVSLHLSSRQNLSQNPELTHSSGVAGQRTLRIHQSLQPQFLTETLGI